MLLSLRVTVKARLNAFLCVVPRTTCSLSYYVITSDYLLHCWRQAMILYRKDLIIYKEVHSLQLSKYFTTYGVGLSFIQNTPLLYHQKQFLYKEKSRQPPS